MINTVSLPIIIMKNMLCNESLLNISKNKSTEMLSYCVTVEHLTSTLCDICWLEQSSFGNAQNARILVLNVNQSISLMVNLGTWRKKLGRISDKYCVYPGQPRVTRIDCPENTNESRALNAIICLENINESRTLCAIICLENAN